MNSAQIIAACKSSTWDGAFREDTKNYDFLLFSMMRSAEHMFIDGHSGNYVCICIAMALGGAKYTLV